MPECTRSREVGARHGDPGFARSPWCAPTCPPASNADADGVGGRTDGAPAAVAERVEE